MKIGILYICTGKYSAFWKDFYESSEKFLLPGITKEYFVFTDASEIDFEGDNPAIHRIIQANLGWPDNTLKRYDMFLKIEERLKNFDYLFFFNANCLFIDRIEAEEILPTGGETLVGCLHPGYYDKPAKHFTFETDKNSAAYIADRIGSRYYAGGINGGKTAEFISAAKEISRNIKLDEVHGLTAVWHDESHWNHYLNGHRQIIKTLTPAFLYPEGASLPFVPKIVIRDKNRLGGHMSFRGQRESRLLINKAKEAVKGFAKYLTPTAIIKLQGGLGNQMSQYAHGRQLMLKGRKIILNTSFFHNNRAAGDTERSFLLNKYRLTNGLIFQSQPEKMIVRLGKKVLRRLGLPVEEYFHGEKYFLDAKNILPGEFTLKNPLSQKSAAWSNRIKETPNSVSLHIRRGDYVSNAKTAAYHGNCPISYYQKAIEIIREKIDQSPEIFIFSDDVAWTKQNLSLPYKINFVSGDDIPDYEEMHLMSLCQHNIIANSTFSWWGAWLNGNPGKIIIAPKQWQTNKTADELDILSESWLRI